MGWAPSAPLSAEAIAVKRAQSPKALLKKHRATLTKIYRAPKSWKPRAELKQLYIKNISICFIMNYSLDLRRSRLENL